MHGTLARHCPDVQRFGLSNHHARVECWVNECVVWQLSVGSMSVLCGNPLSGEDVESRTPVSHLNVHCP